MRVLASILKDYGIDISDEVADAIGKKIVLSYGKIKSEVGMNKRTRKTGYARVRRDSAEMLIDEGAEKIEGKIKGIDKFIEELKKDASKDKEL